MTRAGQMRSLVTIQAVTRTPDGAGGYTEELTDVATAWARGEPLTGQEQIMAMQTGMTRPYRFTMRYRDDVSGATKILYDGRTFDVKSVVDPNEAHRELVIMTEEVP